MGSLEAKKILSGTLASLQPNLKSHSLYEYVIDNQLEQHLE